MTRDQVEVPITLQDEEKVPRYASGGSSGADVKAHLQEPVTVEPGCSVLIPTGMQMAIPPGYEIQVRPRSGLALKNQITVLNTPGTIDADYRGEICVILINHGKTPFVVEPGMRIAQIVLAPVCQANFTIYKTLSNTQRGSGGFGHTGSH